MKIFYSVRMNRHNAVLALRPFGTGKRRDDGRRHPVGDNANLKTLGPTRQATERFARPMVATLLWKINSEDWAVLQQSHRGLDLTAPCCGAVVSPAQPASFGAPHRRPARSPVRSLRLSHPAFARDQ